MTKKQENLASDYWNKIRTKQLFRIKMEAEKNNIKLMLEEKEVKAYPYGVKRVWDCFEVFTELFDTHFAAVKPIFYDAPSQERYHQMLSNEDVIYFETQEEAQNALNQLELATQTLNHTVVYS